MPVFLYKVQKQELSTHEHLRFFEDLPEKQSNCYVSEPQRPCSPAGALPPTPERTALLCLLRPAPAPPAGWPRGTSSVAAGDHTPHDSSPSSSAQSRQPKKEDCGTSQGTRWGRGRPLPPSALQAVYQSALHSFWEE